MNFKLLTVALLSLSTASFAQKAGPDSPDVTGLQPKGLIKLKRQAGEMDSSMTEIGNGYFLCGGGSGDWQSGMGLTILRKGKTASCSEGPLVIAVTVTKKNGMAMQVLESIAVNVPKGYNVQMFNCGGTADIALARHEDKPKLNKIAKAWKHDWTLEPVDPKTVQCENEGYGV